MQVINDIIYAESGKELDLYLPEEAGEPVPMVVWIHGGGWQMGDKGGETGTKIPLYLTEQGYAVASINYRLSGEANFPSQLHDCKAAIRWLRANAEEHNIDTGRIGVCGASAGAHLASLLGTTDGIEELEGTEGNPEQSSSVQAVGAFFGPTDLIKLTEKRGDLEQESPESKLIGGPLLENRDAVARANPITYIKAGAPPFLIVHGEADVVVPVDQSHFLHEALGKTGVETSIHTLPGVGHGFSEASEEQLSEIDGWVTDFFNRHFK